MSPLCFSPPSISCFPPGDDVTARYHRRHRSCYATTRFVKQRFNTADPPSARQRSRKRGSRANASPWILNVDEPCTGSWKTEFSLSPLSFPCSFSFFAIIPPRISTSRNFVRHASRQCFPFHFLFAYAKPFHRAFMRDVSLSRSLVTRNCMLFRFRSKKFVPTANRRPMAPASLTKLWETSTRQRGKRLYDPDTRSCWLGLFYYHGSPMHTHG